MDLPTINLMVANEGEMVATVDFNDTYTSFRALLDAVPALALPDHAGVAAKAANHLTHGYDFDVILDPGAFRTAYQKAYEAEGDAEVLAGRPQLHDYGKQDLTSLKVPETEGTELVFFAKDMALRIAYRVKVSFETAEASYAPLPAIAD